MRGFQAGFAVMMSVSAAVWAEGSPDIDSVREALTGRSVRYDAGAAERAAMESYIKVVDPAARLVGATGAVDRAEESFACLSENWPFGIRYLRINGIYPGAASDVAAKARQWADDPESSGLILDMRDAGGADLESVDILAGLAVQRGREIYSIVDGHGEALDRRAVAGPATNRSIRIPLILVVNGGTHDGSELLAAVLKGRPGVMVVGLSTRGDPRLRELIDLGDGTAIHVATRKFVLSQGGDYEGRGVQPDITAPDIEPFEMPVAGDPYEEHDKRITETWKRHQALLKRVSEDNALRQAAYLIMGVNAVSDWAGIAGWKETAEDAPGADKTVDSED